MRTQGFCGRGARWYGDELSVLRGVLAAGDLVSVPRMRTLADSARPVALAMEELGSAFEGVDDAFVRWGLELAHERYADVDRPRTED